VEVAEISPPQLSSITFNPLWELCLKSMEREELPSQGTRRIKHVPPRESNPFVVREI
jgi:hypothetical protein